MGFKDEINYEKISQLNKRERKSAKLVSLAPEFYPALIKHLKTLQEEYNKRYLESPTSTEALLLNNEICKLDAIIKEIYTRRERKIILNALDTTTTPNLKAMLEHEQRLYFEIEKILNGFREEVLNQKPNPVCDQVEHVQPTEISSTLTPTTQATSNTPAIETTIDPEQPLSTSQELVPEQNDNNDTNSDSDVDSESETFIPDSDSPTDSDVDKNGVNGVDTEKILVHVLEDIQQFVGTDQIVYNLHSEDITTIPKDIAIILEKNNKVKVVETNI